MTLEDVQTLHDGALMPTYGRFPVALESGRGATAVDVGGAKTGRPCNALVGVEVDREAFARRLLAALRRLP